jgi:RNA polymerase sigma factor (sigma-70 family)
MEITSETVTSVSAEELRQHTRWLRALARSLVRDPAVADDLVQDTWLAAMQARPQLRDSPRPWLSTVLLNAWRKSHRSTSRRSAREEQSGVLPSGHPDPLDWTQQLESERRLTDAVAALEEPHRSTILLHFYEELSAAEIARRLNVPASTVRSRIRYGLEHLRSHLRRTSPGDWRLAVLPLASGPYLAARGAAESAKGNLPMWITSKLAIGLVVVGLLGVGAITWTASTVDSDESAPPEVAPKVASHAVSELRAATQATRSGSVESGARNAAPAEAAASSEAPLEQPEVAVLPAESERVVSPDGPSLGPEHAPVTITIFSDFECSFCARVVASLDEVRERYPDKVRLVFKNRPLQSHLHAGLAAEAAMAAYAQGKFWEMSDLLYVHQDRLDRDSLLSYARTLGLDVERFTEELDSGAHRALVQQDIDEAVALGVRGTPSTIINGKLIVGSWPADKFVAEVETALANLEQ